MNRKLTLLTLSVAFLMGCNKEISLGSNSTGEEIKSAPLSGDLGGKDWSFVSGLARTREDGSGKIVLEFSNEKYKEECPFFLQAERMVVMSTPEKAGSYTMGSGNDSATITFLVQESGHARNLIVSDFKIEIDEINEDYVQGAFVATFDEDNSVNGTFEVPFCN